MDIKRMGAATVGLAMTAIAFGAFTPSPAQAAAEDCPTDHVCMWDDTNFEGGKWVDHAAPARGVKEKVEIPWWNGDNEVESIINNTQCWIDGYDANLDPTAGNDPYKVVSFARGTRLSDISGERFVYMKYDTPGAINYSTTTDSVENDLQSFQIDCAISTPSDRG